MKNLFCTLLLLCTFTFAANTSAQAQNKWINEFHYDNFGGDFNEFVEVVLPVSDTAAAIRANIRLSLYNGTPLSVGEGDVYDSRTLDQFTLGTTVNGFSFYYFLFPANAIQNGAADGFSLDSAGTFIQLISYEFAFTAVSGPAAGKTALDVGVFENGSPINGSLFLVGTGSAYSAFTWSGPGAANSETKGAVNPGQTIGGASPSVTMSNVSISGTTLVTGSAADNPLVALNLNATASGPALSLATVTLTNGNNLPSGTTGYKLWRLAGTTFDGTVDGSGETLVVSGYTLTRTGNTLTLNTSVSPSLASGNNGFLITTQVAASTGGNTQATLPTASVVLTGAATSNPGGVQAQGPNYSFTTTLSAPTSLSSFNGTTTQSAFWTAGVGSTGTIVLRRADATPINTPTGNPASYTPEPGTTKVYVGSEVSFTSQSLSPSTPYFYALYAYDGSNNYSPALIANGTTSTAGSGTEAIDAKFIGILNFGGITVNFNDPSGAGATGLIQFTRNDNTAFTGAAAANVPTPGVNVLTSAGNVLVQNLTTQRWWNITYAGANLYTVRIDVSGIGGASNKNSLAIMKRPSSGGDWTGLSTTYNGLGDSLQAINVSGFSQFAIGGGTDNPLPVALLSFNAVPGTGLVDLAWETASEVNSRGFIIHRSEGNSAFAPIANHNNLASLRSAGSGARYQYTDADASLRIGKTYTYRLIEESISGNTVELANRTVTLTEAALPSPVPTDYKLYQNYPNPFNPQTTFSFDLKASGKVTLEVFNMLGMKVATLVNGFLTAGAQQAYTWKADGMPSGIYFYRLTTSSFTQTRKLTLLK